MFFLIFLFAPSCFIIIIVVFVVLSHCFSGHRNSRPLRVITGLSQHSNQCSIVNALRDLSSLRTHQQSLFHTSRNTRLHQRHCA